MLFAIAVGAHIIGNPPTASPVLGAVTFLLAGGTVALVRRPASRSAWAVVATIVLVIAWLEAPTVGNHWLLLGVFAAAVLASLWRRTPWPWLAGTVRVTFMAFYAFAAFAKLNTAFLDPAVSCAVFYADHALTSWGLAPLTPESPLAAVTVVVALVVELSVPVLLIVRRTRGVGVALAAVFHYAISLDLLQHFYDFTSVIFVGLGAWAHEDVTTPITRWLRHRRAVTWVTITWAVLAAAVIAVPSLPVLALARLAVLVLWIPLGALVVLYAVRGARTPLADAPAPRGAIAAILVAAVIVNGVVPYVGLKTANAWNMYANLVTGDGRSNHLVVPAAAQVVDGGYVRVVRTDDEALQAYVGSRWLVPERNLRHHLAARPSASVTYERGDGVTVTGTGEELGRRMSPFVRRLLARRSLDASEPSRCQAVWLPAL
ncbi:MAG TPA: hypothetical protein VFZ70_05790 [Euzebyales bacterium]